ncbi:hypothetical protein H5410_041984, partial [Solanum commersonii]
MDGLSKCWNIPNKCSGSMVLVLVQILEYIISHPLQKITIFYLSVTLQKKIHVRQKITMFYLYVSLLLFEVLSGLHGNKLKSIIYPINGTSYHLGPHLDDFINCEIWNGIIEKFGKRLASCQRQYLSMGGKCNIDCSWDENDSQVSPNKVDQSHVIKMHGRFVNQNLTIHTKSLLVNQVFGR